MPWPASEPRNQVASAASARSNSHGTVRGRPAHRIATVGLPSASTASASARWLPGSSSRPRPCASPVISFFSPTHRIMTSALRAAATAAGMPALARLLDMRAALMHDLGLRQRRAQAAHDGRRIHSGGREPAAEHLQRIVAERPDHRDAARVGLERQHGVLVLQAAPPSAAPPRAPARRSGWREAAARRCGGKDRRAGRAAPSASACGAPRGRCLPSQPARA